MRNPTVRSPNSSSKASTSSMRARESASRSSVNDDPSAMVSGPISRMSARRSRISSKTCCRSSGPRSTWVSAGTTAPGSKRLREFPAYRNPRLFACETPGSGSGDGAPQAIDELPVDHFARHPHRVHNGASRRRPVADDADALDAQEHGPAGGVGVELGGHGRQGFEDDGAGGLGLLGGVAGIEDSAHQELQGTLEGLEGDVAGEAVGDHDIPRVALEMAALHVAADPQARVGRQAVALLRERGPLGPP